MIFLLFSIPILFSGAKTSHSAIETTAAPLPDSTRYAPEASRLYAPVMLHARAARPPRFSPRSAVSSMCMMRPPSSGSIGKRLNTVSSKLTPDRSYAPAHDAA